MKKMIFIFLTALLIISLASFVLADEYSTSSGGSGVGSLDSRYTCANGTPVTLCKTERITTAQVCVPSNDSGYGDRRTAGTTTFKRTCKTPEEMCGEENVNPRKNATACPQLTPYTPNFCSNGTIISQGYGDDGCPRQPKCAHFNESQREGKLEKYFRNENKLRRFNETGLCPNNCTCTGSTTKCYTKDRREMTIEAGNSGNVIIQIKGENMTTTVTLYRNNETGKIIGVFENSTEEIILPDEVRERLQTKIKKQLENTNMTLDEDGFYTIRTTTKSKFLFFFTTTRRVEVKMNAETGEIIKTTTVSKNKN